MLVIVGGLFYKPHASYSGSLSCMPHDSYSEESVLVGVSFFFCNFLLTRPGVSPSWLFVLIWMRSLYKPYIYTQFKLPKTTTLSTYGTHLLTHVLHYKRRNWHLQESFQTYEQYYDAIYKAGKHWIIMIIEICEAPIPRLKALNELIKIMYIKVDNVIRNFTKANTFQEYLHW